MALPPKTMYFRLSQLFPSTIYAGPVVLRFLKGKRGKRMKLEYRGKGKPRQKVHDK